MLIDVTPTMASTEKTPVYIDAVEVSSTTTSSVEIQWRINVQTLANIVGYRVHYQKLASSYIQYGPHLQPNVHSFNVQNLVADTYYRLCLLMYRNDTSPIQKCVDASTRSWHIPVSIGSSIGAVLALSMIVLVILLLRWPSTIHWKGKQKSCSRKYDSISSHFNEDLYDFSESVTMTAGHDEIFSDQSEGYVFELPPNTHIYDPRQCNGNVNYATMHSGIHRKGSTSGSIQNHSSSTTHQHCPLHCNGHIHCCHSNQLHSGSLSGRPRYHSHQDSNIIQDLNHNHHRHNGDGIILHVNEESDTEMESNSHMHGLPHANTEPILQGTEFYEFEMQDIREVNNMPEPEVSRKYLETSIDDDLV